MDLNGFLRGALPTFSNSSEDGNGTGSGFPDGMMEHLVPFLGSQWNPLFRLVIMFYNLAGYSLGFDPSVILALFGLFWALNKLWRQIYSAIHGFILLNFTATINVSEKDEIYDHLIKWLASQPRLYNSRSLTAETSSGSSWEENEQLSVPTSRISPDGLGISLNFANQDAGMAPRFIPAMGLHAFWWNHMYFRLQRKREPLYDDQYGFMTTMRDREDLKITCFGRSPEPIKQLLAHTKKQYYADHQAKTCVRRPSPVNLRRAGRLGWQQVAFRPVRPMRTVVLDARQKVQILTDMNEYLHPATPPWYAYRGIPLRRGYLFHGPPGTGKTSLSFALAGLFGLDIYVISLNEPSLTEEDLSGLFSWLPRRCIVLLEDIDTAGLARAPDDDKTEAEGNSRSRPKPKSASDPGPDSGSESSELDSDLTLNRLVTPSHGIQGKGTEKHDEKAMTADPRESKEGKGGKTDGASEKKTTGIKSEHAKEIIATTADDKTDDDEKLLPKKEKSRSENVGRANGRVRSEMDEKSRDKKFVKDWTIGEFTSQLRKYIKKHKEDSLAEKKTTISLSGLLNAIDGAASHEGRVLIMTTNRPEALDDALIRPGRVDLQVSFTNATHDQTRELFERMYEGDSRGARDGIPSLQTRPASNVSPVTQTRGIHKMPSSSISPRGDGDGDGQGIEEDERRTLTAGELARIAEDFAARLPADQFSPAEIQGFLLKRKKTPRKALAEVKVWAEALLRQKANRSKVMEVQ